ncbi:thymidylate synthase [Actinomycetia phage DSL-LC01]|nr:thymidylate synthase [Actinomycetia phage DSL-LC01]
MATSIKMIEIEDGVNGYVDLVKHVFEHGTPASPRGMNTLEIEDATIYIDNIFPALPLGVGRGTVAGIGAVEACQIMSGLSKPKLVVAVGPQFINYTEDSGFFHGSYGTRTRGQYDVVIDRLKNDKDSRQGVVTLWDPKLDCLPGKKDYPCTVMHQFRIRNNKLNMSVYMRSNDVWLGSAYDFFQFTRVQIAMASVLGIEPGTYSHHVGSLHIYENNYAAINSLTKIHSEFYVEQAFLTGRTWREIESRAQLCMEAVEDRSLIERLNPDERWFTDAMAKAVDKNAGK